MNDHRLRQFAFARLMGSAVASQALLSGASFVVGMLLIRGTSAYLYGAYVLAVNAILLLVSLQNALFNPVLAIRIGRLDRAGRRALVGALCRAQLKLLPAAGTAAVLVAMALWWRSAFEAGVGWLLLATLASGLLVLQREFFRMVLLAYRRAHDVLMADASHALLLCCGVAAAILMRQPAAGALAALGLAAAVSGQLLVGRLRAHEAWERSPGAGILAGIGPVAAWSTAGAAVHWLFSQGYIYLVAARLDVAAVAAIAATRLLVMPVALLSTGIATLLLPLSSRWLAQHGDRLLWRRLGLLALAMCGVSLAYAGAVWWAREWLFEVVLRKQLPQRDPLLLLWTAIVTVIVMRDQLVYLLAAKGLFQTMTTLTLAAAVVSLAVGYLAMSRAGAMGALVGLLTGELISVIGVVLLSLRALPRQCLDPPARLH